MLERLALHRPELRAWALYDWANSAFMAVVVTAVFPIYFGSVAAADLPPPAATWRFSIATTIGLLLIACAAPFLGTLADFKATKKPLLGAFAGLGIAAVAAMYFVERGDWLLAATLFVLANVGANGSFVFYDALLPHVARPDEIDRLSAAGYALGYLGGGLLLAANVLWIERPGWFGLPQHATLPTRLAFVSVAVWWLVFSLPLFRSVAEPPRRLESGERRNAARLAATFRELRGFRQAFLMLVAFLIYNDGIGTIIRMATIYGTEIGIGRGPLVLSILLVQFIGIPCAFLFGTLADRIGAKPAILAGLAVYAAISVLAYFMRTATHFLLLATLVGIVQGGTQALSRSLFASMIPKQRSGEFFGFFAVFEKFAGILGPAFMALAIGLFGSTRAGILSVIAFFVAGGLLLARVDVEAGREEARRGQV